MVCLPPVLYRNIALLVPLLMLEGPLGQAAPPAPASATLALTSCRLEHPSGLVSVAAECGQLAVPENRRKGGRTITLFVARLPALARRHSAQPLFVLAGGPGLGASTFYSGAAPAFARIHRDHDIVIVDQRGTGKSSPLNCAFDDTQMLNAGTTQIARVMRDCRDQLARDHDLTQYGTSIAVQDLDAVRQALGYERNSMASGLKSGRTSLIGLIVSDVTNPFFTELVDVVLGEEPRQLARDLHPELVLELGDRLDHVEVRAPLVLGHGREELAGFASGPVLREEVRDSFGQGTMVVRDRNRHGSDCRTPDNGVTGKVRQGYHFLVRASAPLTIRRSRVTGWRPRGPFRHRSPRVALIYAAPLAVDM